MLRVFNKPALTIDQQVDLLVRRGLTIRDPARLRHYLRFIGYSVGQGKVVQFRAE